MAAVFVTIPKAATTAAAAATAAAVLTGDVPSDYQGRCKVLGGPSQKGTWGPLFSPNYWGDSNSSAHVMSLHFLIIEFIEVLSPPQS